MDPLNYLRILSKAEVEHITASTLTDLTIVHTVMKSKGHHIKLTEEFTKLYDKLYKISYGDRPECNFSELWTYESYARYASHAVPPLVMLDVYSNLLTTGAMKGVVSVRADSYPAGAAILNSLSVILDDTLIYFPGIKNMAYNEFMYY